MSNVLRCVALTVLIMSMSAAVSLAATPYEAPKAVSTPGFDSCVLHGYAGDATVVNVNFTINTDGSVSHVELQGTTGSRYCFWRFIRCGRHGNSGRHGHN